MNTKRAFIYTGGKVYAELVLEKPTADDLVISADAGALLAKRLGVTPNIMVGDFDTLTHPDVPDGTELFRLPAEKDETDTQFAVSLALRRGVREIVMIGGLEGRLDHTLAFLAILENLWEQKDGHVSAIITSGKNRVRFIRNSGVILPHSQYRYFAVIAADEQVKGVTIEGCKYPLKNHTLRRVNQGLTISNEIVGNCALIEIKKGGAWIIETMD